MGNKLINSKEYHETATIMRNFFESKGFIEVHTQSRLSILAACEDPTTVATYNYAGQVWPLPQTGQMWLEYELLNNKEYDGVFCQSTSFRQEPNPIEGRHDLIFPMFEFEARGNFEDLIDLKKELLLHLGFTEEQILRKTYKEISEKFNVKELTAKEEDRIYTEMTPSLLLTDFPEYTSPFWNMKRNVIKETANKVDAILFGIETIGSAEREIDTEIMEQRFHSISDGMYADLLYSHFGKHRVLKELHEFLSLDMIDRFGGGIGMTRLIRALKMLKGD
jgi:aspartyl/asparaginyl-tRNA synthetase